jgi:[ribosomal protein S18]-alanine N-acetyltransferase
LNRRVHIRPAIVADIPIIMMLERQSATAGHWTEAQYRQVFRHESPARIGLVSEAAPPSASGLKSDAGTGILGFLVAQHLAPEWELENLVVAPQARRKGIGKRLLNALLATARKTHSSAVFLEVRDSNAPARALYEKAGFKQVGRRYSYYTNPSEDAILYRRTLD